MKKNGIFTLLIVSIFSCYNKPLERFDYSNQVTTRVAEHNATVGLSVWDHEGKPSISINSDQKFPMQSVFKFHIGLVMMMEIDGGKFYLDQLIYIDSTELLPDFYSPLREKYPTGGTVQLREIIEYTVALSDNVGCDVLLKLLSGPEYVENIIRSLSIADIAIKHNEESMQGYWTHQYDNWTTPATMNQLLFKFYHNIDNILSEESHQYLLNVLFSTSTGANQTRKYLPLDTKVAYKTGRSGKHPETGMNTVINNVGIIILPDDKTVYISIFINDSLEDISHSQELMADLGKMTFDYFSNQSK